MDGVCPGLGDDIDDAAGAAAEFGVCTAGGNLEFLYGFERDVNRRALTAHLLAEEAIIVVAAVEADVIEDAALPVNVDFVAVRPLHDAHAGSQREQILKFAAEHWCG